MRACTLGPTHKPHRIAITGILFLSLSAHPARGQQSSTPSRIAQSIDEAKRIILHGNTHPLARAENERGVAPERLPLDRMLLVLRRSSQQQAALDQLLAGLHDPTSPNFHRWLSPQEFGRQYGPSDEDLRTVTTWLESHGLQVNRVSNGRVLIEFSGTAGQVRDAFHTEIHKYSANGREHWANAADPEIPAALGAVVGGIATLHNIRKAPQIALSGQTIEAEYRPGAQPKLTFSSGKHALGPQDFAAIYNTAQSYAIGINGSGISIAIVARSDIFSTQDLSDFQSLFSLPFSPLTVLVNGPDPGDLGGLEEVEAVLDVTWTGAVAPGANIIQVVSASTNSTDGVDLSEAYIIDNGLADVMSESFGSCEAAFTSAEAMEKSALAEQAAAEGITYFVSSGDSGAEGCDDPNSERVAVGPISVNLLASSPYVVAVGGTEFNEGSGNYWNPSTTSLETALSYIPEVTWNDSCIASTCPTGVSPNIAAGSGGRSTFYPKPPWQMGVSGIPMDGARDLPDVSLTASGLHDPYLLCLHLGCEPNAQGLIQFYLVGGTSVSAPAFAGIMALVDQKAGGRQGVANYVLYGLAAQENFSQCNASSQSGLPSPNCVFNDVTVGNSAVPGETGYGSAGASYQSGVGYDLASGLGSVNANVLVHSWANSRTAPTVVNPFMLNPTTGIQHGTTPVNFSVTVAPQAGTGTPTGDISLIAQPANSVFQPAAGFATLANGSASGTTLQLPGGTYNLVAHYQGDGTFLPSDSAPVQVTVAPEPSSVSVSAFQGTIANPIYVSAAPYGSSFYLGATVAGQSGVGAPSGTVSFFADGTPVGGGSASVGSTGQAALFVTSSFPAGGQHLLTAQYSGDGSFSSSTSSGLVFTVVPAATTLSVAPSASGTASGQPVTLTATLTARSGGNAPTGNVTFFSGTTSLGTAAFSSLQSNPGSLTATAVLITTQLPNGNDSITAQYSGDRNYQLSVSAPVQVTISSTFLVSANPLVVVIASPGQSGSTTLTFTAASGFTGAASLDASACSNLPLESRCSFSPSSFSFTSTITSVPVMLTISTTAAGAGVPPAFRPPRGPWIAAEAILLASVMALFLFVCRTRRLNWQSALAALALAGIALCASCGGGGGSTLGGGGSQGNSGTYPGNYPGVTLTVTINGSTQVLNNLDVQVD